MLLYGVSYGVVLFTISVGLTVTLGLMRVMNLAHGALAAAGGYTALALAGTALPYPLAIAAAAIAVAASGVVLERLVIARLYGASELDQALLTIGLMFVCVAALNWLFGPAVMPARLPDFLARSMVIGNLTIQLYRLAMIALGAVLLAGLWAVFAHTGFGARLRAAVDNPSMAGVVGIRVPALFTAAFCLGSGLAAFGGAVGAPMLPMEPTYPFRYLTLVLVVVSLAGSGEIIGCAIAAIAVGILDTAARSYLPVAGGFTIYLLLLAALPWQQHRKGFA